MNRLEQQFAFILEIDKEKQIGRQTYLADCARKENDAEHAWHAALMTILLSEYANEPIDVLKTVTMLLIHDIVELMRATLTLMMKLYCHAGGTGAAGGARIFGMLPEEQAQRMLELWQEFEAEETAEARFAAVMDRVQPIMVNAATDGRAWREHGVQLSKILKRNGKSAEGSTELWDYALNKFIMPNVEKGRIQDDVRDGR